MIWQNDTNSTIEMTILNCINKCDANINVKIKSVIVNHLMLHVVI